VLHHGRDEAVRVCARTSERGAEGVPRTPRPFVQPRARGASTSSRPRIGPGVLLAGALLTGRVPLPGVSREKGGGGPPPPLLRR